MPDKANIIAYQQITAGTGAAVAFSSIPASASGAVVRANTTNARFRTDGTDPTSSLGFPINTSDTQGTLIPGQGSLKGCKFIAQTGTTTIDILFYAS